MAFWRNSFLSFDNVICFQFLCVLHSVIRSGRCFYIAKQGFLQAETGSFARQNRLFCKAKQALLKISNRTLGFLIIAEPSMLRLHMMDISLSACAYQQAC